MNAFHPGEYCAVVIDNLDALGVRLQRTDDPRTTRLVHPEYAEGIPVFFLVSVAIVFIQLSDVLPC
jgi:hypothetical protein